MTDVIDRKARKKALDVGTSFIVQAPAGSGKTELLIQRYLALLATVERPEEVLAITFTRKASGEMRDRILSALEAADQEKPASDHGAATWALARAVRQRDAELDWRVMDCPARLKVMTIDAFHALLSRQLPVLSGAGGALAVADRPERLYREAARRTLLCACDDDETGAAARHLLSHLDNRFERAENMLVSLLARRDQWLGRVTGPGRLEPSERRHWLEESIGRQIESGLAIAAAVCPPAVRQTLPALADYAARNLEEKGSESPILACRGQDTWPAADVASVPVWKGLVELLLTAAGQCRKGVNAAQGFPPTGADEKGAMHALLESLQDHPRFVELMAEIRALPSHEYDEGQWRILDQLLRLLPSCAAQLELVIREQGRGDYVAVADTARRALMSDEGPTDLALALDYRISHILVDEFQDTSAAQVELLRLLTSGWEAGDGRTLFCVGDPMQSIYGFREAEVGLFLDVRRMAGINEVPVESLTLEVNFRSRQGVVDWVNRTFPSVMPDHEDARLGAVPFVGAHAYHAPGSDEPVCFHAFEEDDGRQEADRVRSVVQDIRRRDPKASVAVLVRGRNHLEHIAPLLRKAGLRFQAVEIEKLVGRPVVQDLMALTRAVSHPADRVAWLACLRAPWCGLTLEDLETLAGDNQATLWECLLDPDTLARVSADGRSRLARFVGAMTRSLAEQGRRPLHRQVEGIWMTVGGPAALESAAALDDARSFFRRLRRLQAGAELDDPTELEDALGDLYGAPDPLADPDLQLMTIHKAKGLQFDYVLLPGLHRGTGADDPQLLHWLEFPRPDGSSDLLLATIEERGQDRDLLHRYIKAQENKKSAYELSRVLYVAATRARRQIQLFGRVNFADKDGEKRPRAPTRGTLMHLLWPSCEKDFLASLKPAGPTESPVDTVGGPAPACIRRLPVDWQLPAPLKSVDWTRAEEPAAPAAESVEFWWAGRHSRAIGTVVHRWLERLASDGLDTWSAERIESQRAGITRMLAEEGLDRETLKPAADKVVTAILNTLSDESGRWLLAGPHRQARSEYAVAGIDGTQVLHGVIDRFIVDEDGTAWVVDYKTGEHAGGDLEGFLTREVERYRPQLERYGRLASSIHSVARLRLALYFPMHKVLRWWEADSA